MTGAAIAVAAETDAAGQALADLVAAGQDLRPVLDEMGEYLQFSVDRRFETETGPDGQAWPPSIRALMGLGKTMTGTPPRLRPSITREVGERTLRVGTNVAYASVHQFGATISAQVADYLTFFVPGIGWRKKKSVTIPARPFLGADTEDEQELLAIAADWLRDAAGPGAVEGRP